jgi:hemerythrin-like metal-binding protein
MSLEWEDSYKIGHLEIDLQHRELFNLANKFLIAPDKVSSASCAMGLLKYTRGHFNYEENLMKKLEYPALEMHIAQHTDLIALLNDVAENITDESLSMQDMEAFLYAWLLDHISSSDTKLVHYVRLQRERHDQNPIGDAGQFADFE